MSKIEPGSCTIQELKQLLREQEFPVLAVLDSVMTTRRLRRARQGRKQDEMMFLDVEFLPQLRKELEAIRELRIGPDGCVWWDGIKIIPAFFSQETRNIMPQVQFVFFLDPETHEMEGV